MKEKSKPKTWQDYLSSFKASFVVSVIKVALGVSFTLTLFFGGISLIIIGIIYVANGHIIQGVFTTVSGTFMVGILIGIYDWIDNND